MARVTGRVLRHSAAHSDYYMYCHELMIWIRVWCTLDGMDCTSEDTLPRGWKFDYTFQKFGDVARRMEEKFDHSVGCIHAGRWEVRRSNAK